MKNCKYYQGNSFDFYKDLRSRKRDKNLIARLEVLDKEMTDCYDWYENNFNRNTLESALPKKCSSQEVLDLNKLYNYDSQALTKLRIELTTTDSKRIVKCQNCTINDVNTFDHLLPQSEFPEFIVNPKNLLCSCSECNSRKGNVWRKNGSRTSLNLYLDILPDVQYLFVNNQVGDLTIETNFYLSKPRGISDSLFNRINSHYVRLNLLRRFEEGSDTVISSLKTTIEPLVGRFNMFEVREIVTEMLEKERLVFGYNYWQTILKLELISNDDFMIDFE